MLFCRPSRPSRILPLRFGRQATHFPSLLLIQTLDKLLDILPRDLFHWPLRVTFEATRVRTHHRFPLGLRHFILAQIKGRTDAHTMHWALVRLTTLIRSHLELPCR